MVNHVCWLTDLMYILFPAQKILTTQNEIGKLIKTCNIILYSDKQEFLLLNVVLGLLIYINELWRKILKLVCDVFLCFMTV